MSIHTDLDTSNYGYPVVIKNEGALNAGIIRRQKINKALPGPEYVVSKIVCWKSNDNKQSPFLANRGTIQTKGNVEHEQEMLKWAQTERLGPILYISLTNDKCAMFVIQYFDLTLNDLNPWLMKAYLSKTIHPDEIVSLYDDLLLKADHFSQKLEKKIMEGKVIMDIKPDNMGIVINNYNDVDIRILDWGAAQPLVQVCWGGVFYSWALTLLGDFVKEISEKNPRLGERLNAVYKKGSLDRWYEYYAKDKSTKQDRISQCEETAEQRSKGTLSY